MKNFTEYVLNVAMLMVLLLPITMAIIMIAIGIIEKMNIIGTFIAAVGIFVFSVPFSYYGTKALSDIINRLY